MAGFLPTNSLLGTLDEYINLSYTITYTDLLGVSHNVTIQPVNTNSSNPSVDVSGNKISGFFSAAFDNTIYYRNKNDSFTTVKAFEEINKDEMYGLVHYNADGTLYRLYTYTATANGVTKEYTINITNNWSIGRNNLIKYSDLDKYNSLNIIWINNNLNRVDWITNAGQPVRWLNG